MTSNAHMSYELLFAEWREGFVRKGDLYHTLTSGKCRGIVCS